MMTSSQTLDRLMSDEQQEKDRRDIRRARFNQALAIVTIVIVAAFWLWGYYKTNQQPKIASLDISNARAIGPTALCPGDALLYSYEFSATGEGVLDADETAWRVDPPQTIVFSQSRRFVLIGSVHERVQEMWVIPRVYQDLATQQALPIPPGNYQRQLAISSPSRSSISAVASVPYSIRAGCP